MWFRTRSTMVDSTNISFANYLNLRYVPPAFWAEQARFGVFRCDMLFWEQSMEVAMYSVWVMSVGEAVLCWIPLCARRYCVQ